MRLLSAVSALAVCLVSAPALAVSLAPHNGEVNVYKNSGFVSIFTPTQVAAGTTVMVPAGRSATVTFGENCSTTVYGPATFQVPAHKGSDCPAGSLNATASGQPPGHHGFSSGLHAFGEGPLIVGGLVVAGGAAAAIALIKDDDKPASP